MRWGQVASVLVASLLSFDCFVGAVALANSRKRPIAALLLRIWLTIGGKRIAPRPGSRSMAIFKIVSFNAEGISPAKVQILSDLRADILCIQETHKNLTLPDMP